MLGKGSSPGSIFISAKMRENVVEGAEDHGEQLLL